MTDKALKIINIDIPENPAFWLAFPSPNNNLIDITDEPTEFIIQSRGESIRVLRLDYFIYPIDMMAEHMCQATYGKDAAWTRRHLKQKYPFLKDDSKIAFFLFKRLR